MVPISGPQTSSSLQTQIFKNSFKEKGMTEDEMVGWHHRLDGHESEQTLGVGDGQGSLVCSSPCGRKELDMTE